MLGRPPKYRPEFSPEEVSQARQVSRKWKSTNGKARRARLALLLAENPELSNTEAARMLGVHRNTVGNWCKRWEDDGFGLEDKPRSGRPRRFSPAGDH
jgi:transposase